VGVVGEIYVRSNRFANEDAVRQIEALGGEVWLPPISEWFHYVNYCTKKRALNSRRYRYYATVLLKESFQHRDEHRLEKIFQDNLRNLEEPRITRTIDMACGYLHPSFEGEAILSLGKGIDFLNKGASGLVNIMPFTCMPGTVVNSLIGRFREEHGHIPFLNLAYDGQEQTHTRTRLEAFMYQVRQFQNRSHPKGNK
jgi:predicted nucleotide-binding protein (sugar kinase/HSP70/actin superfamily)